MSRPRSDAPGWGLGLSRQHLVLMTGMQTGMQPALLEQSLEADALSPGGSPALKAALARLWLALAAAGPAPAAGQRLTVVLAPDLARLWLVQAPPGAASLAEIRAVAQARFEALHGSPAAAWHLVGDWRSDGHFLCAAVPRVLADGLLALCANQGLQARLSTTLGCVLARHARALPDDGFCALRLPEHGLLIAVQRGRAVWLKTWRSGPAIAQAGDSGTVTATLNTAAHGPWAQAAAELRREQLRRGQAMPQRLSTLDLAPPQGHATAAPAPDGLTLHALAPDLGGGAAVAGATAAAMPAGVAAGPVLEARLAARLGSGAGLHT